MINRCIRSIRPFSCISDLRMMGSTIRAFFFDAARSLKKAAPEILIIVAILAQASLFPDYIPTTNDDLVFATTGFSDEVWYSANRPYFLIAGPLAEFATGAAFEARRIYGLHIIAFYAPLTALYLYLRSISKRHIGLFAFVFALSFQVLGYEHTTPLAYPFLTSLALAGAAAAGLFGGRAFKRQASILKRAAYVALGVIASSFYEPFALVYGILFGLSYITNSSPAIIDSPRRRIAAALFGLLPVLGIILSKLAMTIINQALPDTLFPSSGFSTYSGTSLSLASPLLSLRVALNHFIGATILGHAKTSMTWPPVDRYPGAPLILTLVFTLLIASVSVASFQVLLAEMNMPGDSTVSQNCYSSQVITLAIAFSFFAAAAALVLPSAFSTKYHEWLIWQGYRWAHTYLTGSLSTSFGAATAGSLLSLVITNQYARNGRRAASSWLWGLLGVILIACIASFNHNYFVSTVIRERVAVFGEFVSKCRLSTDDALAWATPLRADQFTNLPEINTLCSTLSSDPSLYSKW